MTTYPDRADDLAFLATYIDENWEESIPEREVDVPKPTILAEGERNRRGTNFAKEDIVIVNDGGTVTYEPASIGYRDYQIEAPYDVTIRTSQGYKRFNGGPADTGYPGLTGEVKRIFDKLRFGFGSYDLLKVESYDDNTSAQGADVFEAIWGVKAIAYANEINQSPDFST
jgi:hypothetical protein